MRQLFSRYGIVQTCIVNLDKRHAFVKMINRQDAVLAREGMENFKSGDMQLRVSLIVIYDTYKIYTNTCFLRLAGVLDLDLVTAVTTRQVSVSFQLTV